MEELTGKIKEVVYYANGFGVIKFSYGKTSRTAAGKMPKPCQGDTITMEGEWGRHPKYGRQFQTTWATIKTVEMEPENLLAYLKSGFLYGIGPTLAKNIYEVFGERSIEIIAKEPERLCEVSGITEQKCKKIQESYEETKKYIPLAVYLRGATRFQIETIYQKYGENSVALLKEDIYRVSREVDGIGFLKADKLAEGCGVKRDSPERIRAAILHTLKTVAAEGHCFMHEGSLHNGLRLLLKMPVTLDRMHYALAKLSALGEVVIEDGDVYLTAIYKAECKCAEAVSRILQTPANRTVPWMWTKKAVLDIECEKGFALTEEQKIAVEMAMTEKLMILTGGPGSGKTTVVHGILKAWNHPESVLMAAPTGCAAYQLTCATGERAYTIHRGLQFGYHEGRMGFAYHEQNRLPYDLIILDESSMPNVILMSDFLQAVRNGARLVLIGDKDQLGSIGPGKVFNDLIRSSRIPVVKLSLGHRQDDAIAVNVDRINRGMGCHTWMQKDHIFRFQMVETEEEIQEAAVEAYLGLIEKYGVRHVKFLTPKKQKSKIATEILNPMLQNLVNPVEDRKALVAGDVRFYPNDRVMYTKENNYDKNVFNGEMGTVLWTDCRTKCMEVLFDDGSKEKFSGKELKYIDLCYAQTINKSMGSECKAAVIAYSVSPTMWSRNLLYTAVSRAKLEEVIIGTPKAIQGSLESAAPICRNSNLTRKLKGV